MLTGLRHHSFVRSDDESDCIDAMHAGKHVLYEAFVAGNINKTNAHVAQIQIRKAKIDGDAAPLFFGQSIRIFSCQGLNERALSVIDVTGSADDDGSGCRLSGAGCRFETLIKQIEYPVPGT